MLTDANYLGRGAAGPGGGRRGAAGLLLGAAERPLGVAWNVLLHSGRPGRGLYHLALRAAVGGVAMELLLTGPAVHVAGVALRAAVLVVVAAYGLQGEEKGVRGRTRTGPPTLVGGDQGDQC